MAAQCHGKRKVFTQRSYLTCGMHWRPACEMVDCSAARDAAMLGVALAPSRWCSKSRTAARAMRRSPFSRSTLRNTALSDSKGLLINNTSLTHFSLSHPLRGRVKLSKYGTSSCGEVVHLRTGGGSCCRTPAALRMSSRELWLSCLAASCSATSPPPTGSPQCLGSMSAILRRRHGLSCLPISLSHATPERYPCNHDVLPGEGMQHACCIAALSLSALLIKRFQHLMHPLAHSAHRV